MVEVHYHLLPGVDDGPQDIEAAAALAEASIAEGTTHIVATPHANLRYSFDAEVNKRSVAELKERLGSRVTIGLGCDFHFSYENVAAALVDASPYTINSGRYLLVEFADYAIPPNAAETLYNFRVRGIVPIITHPERNPVLQQKPEMLKPFIQSGCLLQITAGSLLGRFGKRVQSFTYDLVKKNWINLVASDAHGVRTRPPQMGPAHTVLSKKFGVDLADLLCITTPRAIFDNEQIPAHPMPLDLGEAMSSGRRGFFSSLFRR